MTLFYQVAFLLLCILLHISIFVLRDIVIFWWCSVVRYLVLMTSCNYCDFLHLVGFLISLRCTLFWNFCNKSRDFYADNFFKFSWRSVFQGFFFFCLFECSLNIFFYTFHFIWWKWPQMWFTVMRTSYNLCTPLVYAWVSYLSFLISFILWN